MWSLFRSLSNDNDIHVMPSPLHFKRQASIYLFVKTPLRDFDVKAHYREGFSPLTFEGKIIGVHEVGVQVDEEDLRRYEVNPAYELSFRIERPLDWKMSLMEVENAPDTGDVAITLQVEADTGGMILKRESVNKIWLIVTKREYGY